MDSKQRARLKRWVKALRSGKYDQGTGYLRQDSGYSTEYCCLGVLCNIIPAARLLPAESGPPGVRCYKFVDRAPADQVIPAAAWEDLTGLPYDVQSELTTMNDDYGDNFETIADRIESYIS